MMLPSNAVFELTARCNHKCFFCSCPWEHSVDRPVNELPTDEWKKIMNRYILYGVSHISFTGGEASLREDLPELIRYAGDIGYSISLISNGRAVSDEILSAVRDNGAMLSISVPGLETFKDHTGVDNLDNVLALFRKCRDTGVRTTANIAVTKKNLPELYENISYPLLNGADYVLLNRFLPGGRGMSNTEYLLTKDEINEMLDVAESVLERAGAVGHIGTELPYCVVKHPERYKRLSVGYRCGAAKGFFITDPEGYLKVCNHSPQRVCRWTEIESLDTNRYWQSFEKRDYIPKMCKGCEHLDKCDGGCREAAHVFFGEIDDPDPCFADDNAGSATRYGEHSVT